MVIEFTDIDAKYGFPTGTIDSVWTQESGRGQNLVSPAGARGHFQFMPVTRQEMIRKHGLDPWKDKHTAAECCGLYLSELTKRFDGDLTKGLSAYNVGGGNVNKSIKRNGADWLDHLPAETQAYASSILDRIGYDDRVAYGKKKEQGKASQQDDDEEYVKRQDALREIGLPDPMIKGIGKDNILGQLFFAIIIAIFGGNQKVSSVDHDVDSHVQVPNVPNKKPGNTITSPTLYS
jgi:hypothetical protein